MSSNNIMLINFIAETDAQKPGFQAAYSVIPKADGKKADMHLDVPRCYLYM